MERRFREWRTRWSVSLDRRPCVLQHGDVGRPADRKLVHCAMLRARPRGLWEPADSGGEGAFALDQSNVVPYLVSWASCRGDEASVFEPARVSATAPLCGAPGSP
jgi:hypothetical protein